MNSDSEYCDRREPLKRRTKSKMTIANSREHYRFTITELLVVISVISILASLLLPSLKKALEKSRRATCAGQLKQIGAMAQMYANDFEGFLPTPPETDPGVMCERTVAPFGEAAGLGILALRDYGGKMGNHELARLFFCPALSPTETYGPSQLNIHNIVIMCQIQVVSGLPQAGYFYRIDNSLPLHLNVAKNGNRFLVADKYGSNAKRCVHDIGFNVLYCDGSTLFVRVNSSERINIMNQPMPHTFAHTVFDEVR